VKKRPALVGAVADDAIVWESAASLRAYDEEAGQWFEHEPTISKTGLLRKFFAMKGLHLKLSVAESYLKRLRVAAGQPSSPRALRNRLAGVGASTRAVKADLDAFGDLTLLSKDADLEVYMPALTVAFASEPCVEGCRLPPMTLRRLQFVLAGQGVKTTRAAGTALLDKLKTAYLLDKVDVFRDYRCRKRGKQAKFACGIDHSSFHRLESILRLQIALDPSLDSDGLLAFLETLGYTVWCDASGNPLWVTKLLQLDWKYLCRSCVSCFS
jgi:hypothetical protein